jgi:hypothetical protein
MAASCEPTFPIWTPVQGLFCDAFGFLAILSLRRVFATNFGAGRLAVACRGMPKFLSSRRKSPVVFNRTHDNRTRYVVDITNGGRNSAISRRMLAKRFLGMATSAIWNAT